MEEREETIRERIEKDHELLRDRSQALLSTLEAEVPELAFLDWKLEMLARLRDYEHQLKKHFDLEEEGGFMDSIVRIAPHHARQVEKLEDEHEEFLNQLDRSIRTLKCVTAPDSPRVEKVVLRVKRLIERLSEHEHLENELLQDVYYTDYGLGD